MSKKITETKQLNPYSFQYAVKFLCTANIPGTSQTTSSVLPGVYQTAVNIHNPNARSARIRMKIAVPGQISKFKEDGLKPDEVKRVDCERIVRDFGITFIHGAEGFLVIESTLSLDVTAVYTAGKVGGGVDSIAVEQIKERKLE